MKALLIISLATVMNISNFARAEKSNSIQGRPELGTDTGNGTHEKPQLGTDTGNGGDVVICTRKGKREIKMLDLFEAEEKGLQLNLGTPEDSVRTKVNLFLSRIQNRSPRVFDSIKNVTAKLLNEIEIIENSNVPKLDIIETSTKELEDIQDAKIIVLPSNCYTKQLAIQDLPKLPSSTEPARGQMVIKISRLRLNLTYWKELSNDSKALAITHEVLYAHDVIRRNARDSSAVRPFNGLVASTEFEKMNLFDFYKTDLENHYLSFLTTPMLGFSIDGITGNITHNTQINGENVIIVRRVRKGMPIIKYPINGIPQDVLGTAVFNEDMKPVLLTEIGYSQEQLDTKPVVTGLLLDADQNVVKYNETRQVLNGNYVSKVTETVSADGQRERITGCNNNLLPYELGIKANETTMWEVATCDINDIVPREDYITRE